MKNEDFEKMDKVLMERLRADRDKKVPWEILRGFAASVEEKIRSKEQGPVFSFSPMRAWAPVAIPVFAVMVLASLAVLRSPLPARHQNLGGQAPVQLASANHAAELSDDIAVLKELGAWTEEDERGLGVTDDDELEDVELSRSPSVGEKQLA